jgi:hypothetical protein
MTASEIVAEVLKDWPHKPLLRQDIADLLLRAIDMVDPGLCLTDAQANLLAGLTMEHIQKNRRAGLSDFSEGPEGSQICFDVRRKLRLGP